VGELTRNTVTYLLVHKGDAPNFYHKFKAWEGAKVAFTVETADTEARESHTITEARCSPDWPLWEQAIHEGLVMLKLWAPGTSNTCPGSQHSCVEVAMQSEKGCVGEDKRGLEYLRVRSSRPAKGQFR